jgi:hypothetical protein
MKLMSELSQKKLNTSMLIFKEDGISEMDILDFIEGESMIAIDKVTKLAFDDALDALQSEGFSKMEIKYLIRCQFNNTGPYQK